MSQATLKSEKKISGYSIYSKIANNRKISNPFHINGYSPFPNKQYDIILADPPWDYGGKVQYDKSIIKKNNPNYSNKIFMSSANFKYPTLKKKELMEIPVNDISKENCLLFMWTTNPHLEQAIQLGSYWGFEYKTVAFVWNKMAHNPGQYTLSYCELCLLFKRGKIPNPRGARNIKQLINSPRKRHSEKPQETIENIEKMFPCQNKIELFARKDVKGWDNWGLDIN